MPTATEIAQSKKIAVDFPSSLYEETEIAISELHTTRNRDILLEAPYEPVQPQGRQPSQIPAK
jgi:hypothetical protein